LDYPALGVEDILNVGLSYGLIGTRFLQDLMQGIGHQEFSQDPFCALVL
jgi:hypothetical protein